MKACDRDHYPETAMGDPSVDLAQSVASLPECPGVYQLYDQDGECIYIGKSNNLKKRVSSYFSSSFSNSTTSLKVANMVTQTTSINPIVTRTDKEALILERQLIQQHQPKYNTMLKDDRAYPYIRITKDKFPRVEITQKRYADDACYFGPLPMLGSQKHIERLVYDFFKIRECAQPIDDVSLQPKCLKLDLEKCLGPCVNKSVNDQYSHNINQLKQVLSGKTGK